MLDEPLRIDEHGALPEQARAEARQAERATVIAHVRCEPRRWYTHNALPPDPRPRDRLYWNMDSWTSRDDPLASIVRAEHSELRRRMWE